MERPISTHAFHAADLLRFARFLADLLDQRFTIPGTSIRIGLDPIVSLIPGIGDLIANLTGSLILLIAAEYRLPKVVLLRMGMNIAANTILGAVPIFGDIMSIWFRVMWKMSSCSNAMRAGNPEELLLAIGFLSLY